MASTAGEPTGRRVLLQPPNGMLRMSDAALWGTLVPNASVSYMFVSLVMSVSGQVSTELHRDVSQRMNSGEPCSRRTLELSYEARTTCELLPAGVVCCC